MDTHFHQIMGKILNELNKLNASNNSIPQNKNNSQSSPKPDLTVCIFTSIFALIFVIGLIANVLIIIVYIFDTQSKKQTKYFFINLCISDIAVLLVCMPITITDMYSPEKWIYGWIFCKLYYVTEYTVTSVSSFTIILISFNRFIAVVRPLKVI
jgi:hypothetical protein